jgi:hypothetical protein
MVAQSDRLCSHRNCRVVRKPRSSDMATVGLSCGGPVCTDEHLT